MMSKTKTPISKEEVEDMIEFAINRHNRNAGLISMVLGFLFIALFADGFFRVIGEIPPFMGIDVDILKEIVERTKDEVLKALSRS
ncbi:gp7 [Prochlorococcus phage P-RSM4]|uniref:Gp7 n=2 Tax=Thaumasvirus stim4 TaxID=2734148 RepID=E3SLP5_9CAUD|nr:gp7 [Prochlorococcus phage P-RSM4]ADO98393.1 gp7 [Prochlorococcus phage P-RSM4]